MNALLLALCLQAPPTIDVEAGASGDLFSDAWSRIWVTLQNPGADFDGALCVRVHGGVGAPQELRRAVTLPARGKRRIPWDVLLDFGEGEVTAELRDAKGRIVSDRSVPVRFQGLSKRRVVLVGATSSAFDDESIAAVRLKADLLPDRLPALLAADAIVFAEPVPLEAEQEEALERWVEQGGVLVWSAGRLPTASARRLWRELAPAELSGLETASLGGRPVTRALAAARPGAQAFGQLAGRPLGFRRPHGHGAVLLLTIPFDAEGFDAALPGSVLRDQVFPPVLDAVESSAGRLRFSRGPWGTVDARQLRERLRPSDAAFSLPRLVLGGGLVGAYAFLVGPVSWFFLRRGRMRRSGLSFGVLTGGALVVVLLWGNWLAPRPARLAHRVFVGPAVVEGHSYLRAGGAGSVRLSVPGSLAASPGQFSSATFERAFPPIHGEEGRLEVPLPAYGERSVQWIRAAGPKDGLRARWTDATRSVLDIRLAGPGAASGLRVVRREGVAVVDGPLSAEPRTLPLAGLSFRTWADLVEDGESSARQWRLSGRDVGPLDSRESLMHLSFQERMGTPSFPAARGPARVDLSPWIDRGETLVLGWIEGAWGLPEAEPGDVVEAWALARAVVEDP
jgi:hypothetical protein